MTKQNIRYTILIVDESLLLILACSRQKYIMYYKVNGGFNMKTQTEKIPDAELEIMMVLWNHQTPISTTAIHNLLSNNKEWLLATVTSLLNRLTKRGFVSSQKEVKTRYYTPLIKKDFYIACENKSFLEKLNQNSIKNFLVSLSNSNSLSEKDFDELKQFIKEREGE